MLWHGRGVCGKHHGAFTRCGRAQGGADRSTSRAETLRMAGPQAYPSGTRRPGPDALSRALHGLRNFDRAASEHQDLFEAEHFDYAEAGVRMLARDIAPLIGRAGIGRLLTILIPEADEAGPLLLAQQSGLDREHARRLLAVLCDELASGM